jgi:hypothetical protein
MSENDKEMTLSGLDWVFGYIILALFPSFSAFVPG